MRVWRSRDFCIARKIFKLKKESLSLSLANDKSLHSLYLLLTATCCYQVHAKATSYVRCHLSPVIWPGGLKQETSGEKKKNKKLQH